jgi:glycosyltransferase involved in cell wall biosynthesis
VSIKTVHLTNYYHENSGGISTSLNNLLKAAERNEREVTLIVPGEQNKLEKLNRFAKIYYVAAPRSPFFDKRYRLMMPWQYTLKDSVIRRILINEKPDLIEVTDKYTLAFIGAMIRKGFFSKLGRPVLVHFSAERMDDNVAHFVTKSKIGKILAQNYLANLVIPFFDFHVANSEYTASEFFEAYEKVVDGKISSWILSKSEKIFLAPRISLKDRVFVCPRGVNIEFFSPKRKNPEIRQKILNDFKLPEDSILLLYAGRISPEKNVELLVDTMKTLSKNQDKFKLFIAGSGPKEAWLREQAEKMRGKIFLLGHLDKQALADYYANVDIYVHPNPREPFGNVVLEAMASGCAVVVPNSGGVLTYSNQQNSWLSEPSPESFASAIEEIAKNKALRNQKIENAVKTASENSVEHFAERLFNTYDKIYDFFHENREAFGVREISSVMLNTSKERCLIWF